MRFHVSYYPPVFQHRHGKEHSRSTLWYSNMAMEHPLLVDFPIFSHSTTPISTGYPSHVDDNLPCGSRDHEIPAPVRSGRGLSWTRSRPSSTSRKPAGPPIGFPSVSEDFDGGSPTIGTTIGFTPRSHGPKWGTPALKPPNGHGDTRGIHRGWLENPHGFPTPGESEEFQLPRLIAEGYQEILVYEDE